MPRHTRTSTLVGFNAQASLREAITAASCSGGTECGSRHGIAGRRLTPVAGERVPVTGASEAEITVLLDMDWLLRLRLGLSLQLELRIAESAHFGQVQTLKFGFCRNALANHPVNQEVENETERKDKANERDDTDQLCHQLATIVTVEQAGDRTGDAVPGAAVVALAIGEESDGKYTPQTVGAVDGDGTDRIVHLKHPVNKYDRDANQNTGDEADDHGADGIDEA